jgi:hypothetical protein
LYQVWLIEYQLGMKQATRTRVARVLGVKPSYLGKIISQIWKISEDCYIRSHRLHGGKGTQKPGPPRVYYELIGDRLVTFPETALILLRLMDAHQQIPRRVERNNFVKRLIAETNLDEAVIVNRIDWARKNDYVVYDEDATNLACLERAALERSYLEMVAKHFSSGTPSATAAAVGQSPQIG